MGASLARVAFGDTGLTTSPLGLGSSYGLATEDVLHAFDRGVTFYYWGALRRPAFGRGVASIAREHRDEIVVAVQSFSRIACLVRPSVDRALGKLGIEHADILILGWWNGPPPARIVDAALRLRDAGRVRHIVVSSHNRPAFERFILDPTYSGIMVRYNAAHTGAERDTFPHLEKRRVGVIAFTATRWGQLPNPRYTPKGDRTPRGSDCYRFCLSNRNVDVCLAGPKDRAQLDEALAALERGPMSEDELAWMRRVGVAIRGSPAKAAT